MDKPMYDHAEPYSVEHDAMHVSTDRERLDLALIYAFLRDDAYWSKGLPESAFLRALARSLPFGLYRAEQQLGFARVISDGARFAYLADVFIVPSARGHGLGKWLVQCVLAHPEVARTKRVLLGTRDAHMLYTRFAFKAVPDGLFMARDLPVFCAPG